MGLDLPTTVLGRTGLVVTRLGIGGAYCDSVDGYRAALDCGVNYVDTARSYRNGEDEKVVGQAIKGQRDRLVLATKSLVRDAAGARAELEASLRALDVDYVDIWQLHYVNTASDREQVLGPGGALEAALKAREQGLIRFIGVTGHDWVEVGKDVATGHFDTVLCWYNCAMKEPEQLVFPEARRQDTGVVIMQATRVDKLFSPTGVPAPADFYRYVISNDDVGVVLVGLRDVALFQEVAKVVAERPTLTQEERAALEDYGAKMRAAGQLDGE
jgi:aryl-alcohol dehydrogenase-like predicted oxidoreductase